MLYNPTLKKCGNIINTFGVFAARAGGGELLRGLDWLPCMMLEYADQGCVWETVSPAAGPPQPLCAKCGRHALSQLCLALKAVHKAGFMHRDVKPENLLMAEDKDDPGSIVYKLCDFGSAAPHPGSSDLLLNDRTQGTPRYLPPDVYWWATSDTWQAGKCLLALRSGAPPHLGDEQEVRASGMYDHLRDTEWEFLKRCLSSNGSSRQGAGALFKYGVEQHVYPSTV
jgi:serine/threonine protein kinase